ncbi:hypothetical protein KCU92_g9981, partial [Aureobasidium melanogenum]
MATRRLILAKFGQWFGTPVTGITIKAKGVAIMFSATALSVFALGVSIAASLPTNVTGTIDLPALGSFVDYSGFDLQPLQDASALNGATLNPILGGVATLRRRQDIDFALVDSTPDPVVAPNNYTNYNQQAAINAVLAEIISNPLPQKRSLSVKEHSAAVNAPLNCNGADTFMGSKLFSSRPFDESLCAVACTA